MYKASWGLYSKLTRWHFCLIVLATLCDQAQIPGLGNRNHLSREVAEWRGKGMGSHRGEELGPLIP